MWRRSVIASVVFGFVVTLTSASACAQVAPDPEREAAEALRHGEYAQARRLYADVLDAKPEVAPQYAESFLALGDYDEGLSRLSSHARSRTDPHLLYAQGRLLAATGRYAEAEEAFRSALDKQPELLRNKLELALLLEATGRKEAAFDLYLSIYRRFKDGALRTASDLSVAGLAAARLEQYHEANDAYRRAHNADPQDVQNLFQWAELFREKYNEADAQRTYEEALEINPHRADLLVGYARSFGSFEKQEELARQALKENPRGVDALVLLAELQILDGQYAGAIGMLNQALEINPASMPALAQLASAQFLSGDTTAFGETERRATEINPRNAGFYITLAENCVRRFRYPDAVTFGRKAVEADRSNVSAVASYGVSLLRLGNVREARPYLEAAFERDPFNLFVANTLTLLDSYEGFDTIESEHFELLIDRSERDLLGPAILSLAEEAYDALSARYGYRPEGKIRIEAYSDPDDFAVRIAGVPHLGLLGVSFGDVVAFDTPKALGSEPHNWARTLWHELAHTMAIGASKNHVPRWFTEGLSVYEEQLARPEWGREMELELFAALDADRLLPLDKIDQGFTRPSFPGQVLLSYYHASRVIAYIANRYGAESITRILTTMAENKPVDQAIREVTGTDMASLDRNFRAWLRQERQPYASLLAGALGSAASASPAGSGNTFFKRLEEGHALLESGSDREAEAKFLEAIDLYPGYTLQGNAYEPLAAIYEKRGDTVKRIEILERFLSFSDYGAPQARELARLYHEAGDDEKAMRYLLRSIDVEPYDREARALLADLFETQGRYEEAVNERRALLALDPVDKAAAYYGLASSLYKNRQISEAKRAVLQALELAPGYREAQKLLLQCVEAL